MDNIIHLQYKTHAVHITTSETTGNIVCFKYNQRICDFESFDPVNLEDLSEYMISPLPGFMWGFKEDLD